MKRERAVETIPNKLWITYDSDGNKTGTLTFFDKDGVQRYGWIKTAQSKHEWFEPDAISENFEFEDKPEMSSWHQEHVYGYPVPKIETFKTQERENLPCFTKTPTSKVFFAAGYYGINFDNGGWMEAFTPKLSTLRKYEYIGPFKTATDAQIAIKRKQRNYE